MEVLNETTIVTLELDSEILVRASALVERAMRPLSQQDSLLNIW